MSKPGVWAFTYSVSHDPRWRERDEEAGPQAIESYLADAGVPDSADHTSNVYDAPANIPGNYGHTIHTHEWRVEPWHAHYYELHDGLTLWVEPTGMMHLTTTDPGNLDEEFTHADALKIGRIAKALQIHKWWTT